MGVGIIGGVPIQPIRKKEDMIEVVTEMDNTSKEDQESTDQSLFQQWLLLVDTLRPFGVPPLDIPNEAEEILVNFWLHIYYTVN